MEQKTEASQAVDEQVFLTIVYQVPRKHAHELAAECGDSAHFSAASWSHALYDRDQARAALKAQPAPTEAAQVTVTVERGGVYITKGVQSFRLAYEGETRGEQEWYAGVLRKALAAPTIPAIPGTKEGA